MPKVTLRERTDAVNCLLKLAQSKVESALDSVMTAEAGEKILAECSIVIAAALAVIRND